MVIGLCERFHKLPSEIKAEDAEFLKYLEIIAQGTLVKEVSDGEYG